MTERMTVGRLIEYLEDLPMDTPVRGVVLPRDGEERGHEHDFGVPVCGEAPDGVTRVYLPIAQRLDELSGRVAVALRIADEDLGWEQVSP